MKVTEKRLPRTFYEKDNVVSIAKSLLGKVLCVNYAGVILKAMITETEAYSGQNDKACHAHLGKFTKRTSTMYEQGGTAYIYLCYGIHNLFNVVTNVSGKADAVLIRSVEPLLGLETMLKLRNKSKLAPNIIAGPGKLTKAMSIHLTHNGLDLVNSLDIYLIENKPSIFEIIESKRIGVDYAGEDALLPWRFYIAGNKYVSSY